MARPIYDFELTDPDFSWLLEQYQERFPMSFMLSGTPIVIFRPEQFDGDVTGSSMDFYPSEDLPGESAADPTETNS